MAATGVARVTRAATPNQVANRVHVLDARRLVVRLELAVGAHRQPDARQAEQRALGPAAGGDEHRVEFPLLVHGELEWLLVVSPTPPAPVPWWGALVLLLWLALLLLLLLLLLALLVLPLTRLLALVLPLTRTACCAAAAAAAAAAALRPGRFSDLGIRRRRLPAPDRVVVVVHRAPPADEQPARRRAALHLDRRRPALDRGPGARRADRVEDELGALGVKAAEGDGADEDGRVVAERRQEARALERHVPAADDERLAGRRLERKEVVRGDGVLGGALKVGGDMWTAAGGEDDVPRRDDARAPLGVCQRDLVPAAQAALAVEVLDARLGQRGTVAKVKRADVVLDGEAEGVPVVLDVWL